MVVVTSSSLWPASTSSSPVPLNTEVLVAEWSRYRIVAALVPSSSPVPLKTHRVEQRCTLNVSRTEAFSCWCGS
ncbi:hypothetical protein TNCV_4096421 [Trichonephila clavipes]|nr:hypothetical protein TNCV_4096421 [Trichonephila clavipes]